MNVRLISKRQDAFSKKDFNTYDEPTLGEGEISASVIYDELDGHKVGLNNTYQTDIK
jgi:hypothetical protein